jgi:hypothetical protein
MGYNKVMTMNKLRRIPLIIFMVILLSLIAIPVLAYDGMGGVVPEYTIGSAGTNNSFLVINTLTSPIGGFDIRSSSTIPSGINQATELARSVLPLMALVSILIISRWGNDYGELDSSYDRFNSDNHISC